MFEPGTLVDGKYPRVALKCMNERVDDDAISTERFMREARAAANLRSEHICRVLDVGEHAGSPYIVMELLEGTDLARGDRAPARHRVRRRLRAPGMRWAVPRAPRTTARSS